jgi:hypothetical protein
MRLELQKRRLKILNIMNIQIMVATHQVIRLKGEVLGEKEPIVCSRKRSNKAHYVKRGIGCKLEAKLVMITF